MIFILSTRHPKKSSIHTQHIDEFAHAHYLILPDDATSSDYNIHQTNQEHWIADLTAAATSGHHPDHHPLAQFKTGNILFFEIGRAHV